MKDSDVVIVGGGPAGAYCAYQLAKKGVYPIIFDNSHPREKPCGGGISAATLNKFPFVKNFLFKGVGLSTKLKIISPLDNMYVANSPEKGFNVSRRAFDEEILSIAIARGAKLVREKVTFVQHKNGKWKIKAGKETVSTKMLVGADGTNSLVRSMTVGAHPKTNLALTYGYFATDVEKAYSVVKYLAEIPSYIWIFPRPEFASVGIGGELGYGSSLKNRLDDFIHSYCPKIRKISKFAALLPSANDEKFFAIPCAGTNWVLVGDAAGHVDPITGEGILYALWSGKLAANAITQNNLGSYDELWRREYGDYFAERCKMKEMHNKPSTNARALTIERSLFEGLLKKKYSWIHEK